MRRRFEIAALRRALALLGSFFLISASGCAAAGAVGTYLKNRALDLTDPVPVTIGTGVGASARVTGLLQAGAEWRAAALGSRKRLSGGYGLVRELGIAPFIHMRSVSNGKARESTRSVLLLRTQIDPEEETWLPWYGGQWHWLPPLKEYATDYDRDFLDIGASLFAGVGLEVSVNPIYTPLELADFIAGFFTIDLMGDDHRWKGPRLFDTEPPGPRAPPSPDGESASEAAAPAGGS